MEQLSIFPTRKKIIAELRDDLKQKAADKGCECPVCGQFAKVYRRSVNSTMANMLIRAYNEFHREWFHISDIGMGKGAGSGDFSKLQYFDLIQREDHNAGDQGKKTSGRWRITEFGVLFIQKQVYIQKYALVYNAEKLGYEGEHITIDECLGDKFDYNQLMAR